MSDTSFSRLARSVTEFSGSVYATVCAFIIVLGWVVAGVLFFGFGDFYQIIINTFTTCVTFLMVFLIQHTQNHDTQALHLKIDEILLKMKAADNALIGIEKLDEDQLQSLAEKYEKIAKSCRNSIT